MRAHLKKHWKSHFWNTFKIPEYLTVPGDGLADVGVPVCQLRVINDQGGRGRDVCANNSTVRWIEQKLLRKQAAHIILDSTVTLRYIVLVHILAQCCGSGSGINILVPQHCKHMHDYGFHGNSKNTYRTRVEDLIPKSLGQCSGSVTFLVRIRMRMRILGSVPLTNGFGSVPKSSVTLRMQYLFFIFVNVLINEI